MAWRIDEQVIKGEIDNRVRGRTTGRIWFTGRDEPVELALTGNCWRDLAGRRLEFVNPEPKTGDLDGLAPKQKGAAGDITASRKVKVPEIPMEQIGEYYAQKKPWPWHWGNSLYLEWFSERNGRVVIESASFELKMVGEAAWEMSAAEEETERQANAEAMTGFMQRMVDAAADGEPADSTVETNEGEPLFLTEEAAERLQAESDLLMDRVQARLTREGAGADYEKILREEIDRFHAERNEPDLTPEKESRRDEWIEMMNRAERDALDFPEAADEAEIVHPLAERAHELTIQLMEESEAAGWQPADATEEHPAADLVNAVTKAATKLGGALNGYEWPPDLEACASTIVRLKRARVYLDDALCAAESCQEQKLIDVAWLGLILVEVIDLAHDADEIIAELRERLS